MGFSYTGLAYSLLLLSLIFLTYRIFKYSKQKNDITSKYFFYFCLSLVALALVRSVTGLLFARNTSVLFASVLSVSFIEGVMASIVAYLVIHVYFKSSKVLPWIGFAVFLALGLLTVFLTLQTLPGRSVSIEESGSLNLNVGFLGNITYTVLRVGLFAFSFIPLMIIFLQQFFASKEVRLKTRAIGLVFSLLLGFFIGSLDFVILELLKLGAITRDVSIGIVGVVLFLVVYFTQKPIPEEDEKLQS